MQCSTLYRMQISINKWHTTLLSTLYVLNSGGRTSLPSPSVQILGGRVPPSPRDLRPWLVAKATIGPAMQSLVRVAQ